MFRSLDASWLDLKLGIRMLWKYPGLSLIGGLAMAVAIAFGTAMLAFFHSQLDSSLPLPEGDRIVALENWDTSKNNEERRAADDLSVWRREMKTVQEIGAFRNVGRNLIVAGRAVEPIRIAEITAAGFGVARTAPILGRPILPTDEVPEAEPVLLIGYDIWQSRFAGDLAVIGRPVRIGATHHTIIGVMPAGFAFPMNHSYWTPLRIEAAHHPPGAGPAIFIFGRLAPGETMASAQAELAPIGQRRGAEYPSTHGHLRPQVLPYTYTLLDIQDVTLWQVAVMQGMISMLLVIVAVNVGILIYARTATRQGEIAIRGALGASRFRIVGQLFVEALVLAVAAGAVGVMMARVALTQGNAIMQSEFGRMPFWLDDRIPPVALLYTAAVIVFAAVVAGILPALQATRYRAASTLRELGGSTGIRLGATWTVLIVAQVGLAVAGLPVIVSEGWREVRQATSAPTFRMEEYMAVRLSLDQEDPPPGVRPDAHRTQVRARLVRLHSEMANRIESDPAVVDVTSATAIPGGEPRARIRTEGSRGGEGLEHEVRVNRIAEDFFDAFDAAVLTGRVPTVADRNAVLVNRTFARRVFGDADPLGRRIQYLRSEDSTGERWFEVIGIVEDLYTNSLSPEIVSSEIYHPLQAADAVDATFILRMRGGEPAALGDRLRKIATDIEPDVRVGARPMTLVYQQDRLALRLVIGVLGAIMSSVLLLSSAGIYALVSFTVSRRRKEIGVRAALGAEPGRLLRSVFARAAGQIALGLVTGVLTIVVLDTLAEGSLLGGKGKILLPAVSLMMVTAGVLAVVGPARRALRIQPIEALREE
jgi:putative ABC transport system permease protein